MDVYIKNMVCPRCISAVERILHSQGLPVKTVELGYVKTQNDLSNEDLSRLGVSLQEQGFELLDDKRKTLVEQIKNIIVNGVHYNNDETPKKNLSDILSDELGYDYKYLSTLFSEITGTTIEKFQIKHKIERVKELLVYDQLSLKEIAYQLGYSSEAYLSNQFKKTTGISPTHFKQIGDKKRNSLDSL